MSYMATPIKQMVYQAEVGRQVERLRTFRQMSQSELAVAWGKEIDRSVSQVKVSRLEQGNYGLRLDEALALTRVLGPDVLHGFENPVDSQDAYQQGVRAGARQVTGRVAALLETCTNQVA